MNDKANRVSTEVSAGTSQLADTDRTRIGGVKRTTTLGAPTLQCVKSSGENNATIDLNTTILIRQKRSDDRASAINLTIGCNSTAIGQVEETPTTAGSMEASSDTDTPYGIPSEKPGDAKGKKSSLIIAGINTPTPAGRKSKAGASKILDAT